MALCALIEMLHVFADEKEKEVYGTKLVDMYKLFTTIVLRIME